MDLALRSATELLSLLEGREVSSLELVELFLERIERLDPGLGAVVTLDAEGARAAAVAADRARAGGTGFGALLGLPITVKDCLSTRGIRTTSGAEEMAGHVPAEDAVAVGRLRDAGAIVLGKSNLPAWASDWQTTNSLFGTTTNPWDRTRTPGGSSGGAAVAVACGFSSFDVGSDMGGSIRLPASWCGVYGLKPTWGVVPLRGHVPPPPGVLTELDVATIGPLARSADDLELALSVMAGPYASRAQAWRLELPGPRGSALREYRIGVWLDDPLCSPEPTVLDALSATADAVSAAGATVVDVAQRLAPAFAETYAVAQHLLQASVSPFVPDEAYAALVAAAAGPGTGPHERWARHVTSSARAVNVVAERRLHLEQEWAQLFEDVDVVLCPVSPTSAPLLDDRDPDDRTVGVDGPERSASDQFAWLQAVGTLHLPSVSAPVGRTPRGLPVGVQVVGPVHEDLTAIDVARRMADVVGGYEPPPI